MKSIYNYPEYLLKKIEKSLEPVSKSEILKPLLEVVSEPQIRFKSKARGVLKAERTR